MSTPSPTPTPAPACRHFGTCGGCQTLDQAYEAEVRDKEQSLRALFEGGGIASSTVRPLLSAQAPEGYRTTLKVPFAGYRGEPQAGFYRAGTHEIVNLEECAIQHPALVELLQIARELAAECRVSMYHEARQSGVLRALAARVGQGTGALLVGLVVRRADDRRVAQMAQKLYYGMRRRGLVGVVENHHDQASNAFFGKVTRVLHGEGRLPETFDGLQVQTSLTSFSQSNHTDAETVYRVARELLEPVANKTITELYSGWAPLGLRLAAAGAKLFCVEQSKIAVRDGQRNAKDNGLSDRISFCAMDAAHGLLQAPPSDAVIVDPPRKGLDEMVRIGLQRGPAPHLVYISCNPVTLLRDIEALADRYQLESIQPVDLFPRTPHVECVASLRWRNGS